MSRAKYRAASAAILCLVMAGCASTGTGFSLVNPTTWFSGSEGRKVEQVTAKRDEAQQNLLEGAQRAAHEAQEALKTAPADDRSVGIARDSNDRAVEQLDQALGPLTLEEAAKIRKENSLLLSEVKQLRQEGEDLRDEQRAKEKKNSAKFAKWSVALNKANLNLADGFARENALANKYRNLWFAAYALAGLSVILGALYLYAKFALGGIPKAMASGLSVLRARGVIPPSDEPNVFDSFLNRIEQKQIGKHV